MYLKNGKRIMRIVAMAITVAMVLGMSVAPTFAATSSPKTSITAASVYYNNNAKITWAKASGAVKYQVYRKRADESSYRLMTTTTRTFYRSEDLKYNTKYYYKIKALNSSGRGRYSTVKSITTKASVGTPVNVDKTLVGANTIAIKWMYGSAEKNVVSYSVMRRTASSNYLKLDELKTKDIVKDTNSANDYFLPQNTNGYPYCSMYYERDGKLTFVDHDSDLSNALKKKVDNQAKINKAYNTYYYYKIIAKYADGSIRSSKTVKIKTNGQSDYNSGLSDYPLWNTFY